jgi:hypothetical protein
MGEERRVRKGIIWMMVRAKPCWGFSTVDAGGDHGESVAGSD